MAILTNTVPGSILVIPLLVSFNKKLLLLSGTGVKIMADCLPSDFMEYFKEYC